MNRRVLAEPSSACNCSNTVTALPREMPFGHRYESLPIGLKNHRNMALFVIPTESILSYGKRGLLRLGERPLARLSFHNKLKSKTVITKFRAGILLKEEK